MNIRRWVYGGLAIFAAVSWAAYSPYSKSAVSIVPALTAAAARSPSGMYVSPASASMPWERPVLEAAVRDPFAPVAIQEVVVKPSLPAVSAAVVAVPPAPAAPPLNLQFSGRMIGPDGKLVVFASMGNETMSLLPGTMLPNGYVVQQIDEHSVELVYPPLQTTARLDLPPPPSFEVR